MNGFLLFIPIFLIRYGVLYVLDKEAFKRAAFFPPPMGREKVAFWIYQISTAIMVAYMLFLSVKTKSVWFYAGVAVYCAGIVLCAVSTINYARPSENGMNLKGLYRVSRNPMYIAYFICFLGCALLTESLIMFALLTVFQASAHWIILSEERWCISRFGNEYIQYMKKVRRYI